MPEEICQTRRVWIECWGLPIHAWSEINLSKIKEVWGKVVDVCMNMEDLSCVRVLIDTTVFTLINRWICFNLNGTMYDVFVKESHMQHKDHEASDVQYFLERNNVQMLIDSAKENKEFNSNGCMEEDDTLHGSKEIDVNEGEQQLVQSILHNNQANEVASVWGTKFKWDIELRGLDPLCFD